jgi:hypothetical protein
MIVRLEGGVGSGLGVFIFFFTATYVFYISQEPHRCHQPVGIVKIESSLWLGRRFQLAPCNSKVNPVWRPQETDHM